MNFCFLGSSDFSIFVLKELIKKFRPNLVITLPAKAQGRGLLIKPNQVYSFCLKEKLNVIELKLWQQIKNLTFDFGLIAGFGKIIPANVLVNQSIFKRGLLNLHPSLLPLFRGADPIRQTILNGEKISGATLIELDQLVDHGPIVAQTRLDLDQTETLSELTQTLGRLSGQLFNQTIELWLTQQPEPKPQDEAKATWTKKVSKTDGQLNLDENYDQWQRKIRALNPWPGAFIQIKIRGEEKLLKIYQIEKINHLDLKPELKNLTPAKFFQHRNELGLKIATDFILIKELQIEGKKRMGAKEFLNGYKIENLSLII